MSLPIDTQFHRANPYNYSQFNIGQEEAAGQIRTVREPKSIEQYITDNFNPASNSDSANHGRRVLREQASRYGREIQDVRGNCDCGPTSIALGLLYHIKNNNSQGRRAESERIIGNLFTLVSKLTPDANLTSEDLATVGEMLANFAFSCGDYLFNKTINNDILMLSFSRVLRAIGNREWNSDKIPLKRRCDLFIPATSDTTDSMIDELGFMPVCLV